ncbi:MAG: tetratricopeptide repeat protein [Gemmatimonadetes bacterium]|nr:tetratricopeptide repeat protein [Gemmatimonadota bacterium]
MKSISKLKDEARKHEQREEWEKAIQAYLQVLRIADEGETEVELPLYNRLGDLCVRLGKHQEAVRHYEQAADRYSEAGLYNNAIALCNKALRYSPDRLELIRKLGQFSASQGFITDARRYFLDYAERQFKAGKVSEALNALEDFANVSDDADIREMLGRQLKAHGRINDAVDELRRAHALRTRDGQMEEAAVLHKEILEIDPTATFDGTAAAPSGARSQTDTALPGLVDIEPDNKPVSGTDPAPPRVEGLEAGALPEDDTEGTDPIQLAGYEATGQPDLADIDIGGAGSIEGLETTSFDFGEVDPNAPALEDLGLEREESSFDGAGASGSLDLPTLDEPEDSFDLPTLDDPESSFDLPTLDEPESSFDLPTLDEPESSFDLPTLDEPDTTADLPTLDDPKSSFDLPTLDDPKSSFDLPTLDEPESAFDLPTLDEPDSTGELPTLDEPERSFDLPTLDDGDDSGTGLTDDTGSMDLGGDLPLDLDSLIGGGDSVFDLPASSEDVERQDWKSGDPPFEIPELDGDTLGLPTWEPESGSTFEVPSLDPDGIDTEDVSDAGDASAAGDGEVAGIGDGGDVEGALDSGKEATEAADVDDVGVGERVAGTDEPSHLTFPAEGGDVQEAVNIPAIELPTWDTGILADLPDDVADGADADTDDAGEVVDDEASEPAWVESIASDDDDVSSDLPTFTYEDDSQDDEEPAGDDSGEDAPSIATSQLESDAGGPTTGEVGGGPVEVREGGAASAPDKELADEEPADDDPLGLASHLAGMGPGAGATGHPPVNVPEVDWLDDIAEDEIVEEVLPESADLSAGSDDAAGAGEAEQDPAVAEPVREASADDRAVMPQPSELSPTAPTEDYIDLGALVTADDDEETTRFRVQETAPTGDEDRDFAELLSQFKSKVHEHLPPEDAAAHYDLGLAFKEMGLLDEAIGEFQVALRAGHMRLKVYEELGQCFLQKEQFNIAEKVLNRALALPFDDELELLGVYYHLGRTYEALGRRDQARDAYERVLGMDINFGDVTDRLARL